MDHRTLPYVAPSADAPGVQSYRMPAAREFPRVDDCLVEPETREEMFRGERMLALPALPPHADQHSTLDLVIGSHVAEGYITSTDLLTRFDEGSNFASDVCVRKAGVDEQGSRHLEELAFEVVATQTRRHMTERAEVMSTRGVRRVVAIFVDEHRVAEWQPDLRRWQAYESDASIDDPLFVRPVLVRALLDGALALDEAVKAAEIKGSPRTRAIREEGRREGKRQGKREGLRDGKRDGLQEGELAGKRTLIESFCTLRSIPLSPDRRRTMLELDAAQLDALFARLVTDERWPG